MKKGDATLNIIIVAIILLITALVMIAIFTGRMGSWSEKVGELQENSCAKQGYSCVDGFCAENQVEVYGFICEGGKTCCRQRIQ